MTINLFPWRQELSLKKKRQAYFIFAGLFLITGFLAISEKYSLLEIKEKEEQEYLQLKNNLNELDSNFQNKEKDEQLKLQEKMFYNQINKKTNNSKRVVFFLSKITKIIPKDTSLEKIEKQNKKVLLTGYSSSEEGTLRFLKAIKEEVNRIEVLEIKKTNIKKNKNKNEFKFSVPIKLLMLINNEKISK